MKNKEKKELELNLIFTKLKEYYNKEIENINKNKINNDWKLYDLKKDLHILENQIKDKNSHIYIYFKYISKILNYENLKGLKFEITEENFYYFLEIIPPLKMNDKGFIMSEFLTGNLTHFFYEKNEKYYIEVVEVDKCKLEKEFWGDY